MAVPTKSRKVVTAVFGDLVGSTALQERLDPESAQRVMSRFYEVMRAVIARHGGQLDKFVGDGVVAVFGVPSVAEDDALRAVRCAADMVAELAGLSEELRRGWGVALRMRTGVNTGELVISGDGELVGDAINTAARLEQAAAPGEVLIGEDTWRLVRDGVQLEPVEALMLKGKAEPVRAWRLLAAGPAPERARADVPLVGRADELERLRHALEDARRETGCRLVTVIGSPGMGKSRLAEEFALAVRDEATVVLGRCEPSGEGITFGPVAELLRGAADIGETDPPEVVRAKLTGLVGGERDTERIVARAGSLLGVAEPASVQETFWGVRRVLEALARDRPLVVLLEDVHWGQPLLLDLVEHLAEWVRDAPMLLLVLSRPELRETREALTTPGRPVADVIELAALEPGESRTFVDGMLGRAELPPDLLERILETTEGNPLFLGETLRMLVDDGSLLKQGEVWVTAGTDVVAVPPTIHALLSARIERLRGEERAVVERASVIGKQFYRGAVASLVPEPVRFGLDGHLETLRRKEMVEPDGTYWVDEPVYRFHHVLLRDAAYRSLLKEARAELHERFADWLTTKAGELVGEHEEVIGFHLEQAHSYRSQLGVLDDAGRALGPRAAAMLGSAGRRALARADLAAAANLLGRACERVEVDDPELLWDRAEALLSAGDTAAAAEVVDRLAGARADVLAGQIALLTGAGDPEAIVARLTAAAEDLAADGDGVGAAKAHHVAAEGLVALGRFGAAEAELDQALVAARKVGDRRRTTAVLAAAPRAALWGPSPMVRSSGRCLDVLRILRMTPGNRHVEAIALRCQAVLEAVRGRFEPARAILETARVTLHELGLSWELHELAIHAGQVELLAGDPAAAEAALRQARDGFTALGVDTGAAQAAALLARALVEQGRDDEAIEQTRFAEQHAGGDLKTIISWLGARAEALARTGSADEAVELAHRAVDLAEPTDALPDKADAALALARVLRTLGRADQARVAASQARELYQAKDHAVGVARATELAGALVVARAVAKPERAGVLGDRPPERVIAEWSRSWRTRNVEKFVGLFAEDIVRVDHRTLGWDDIHGLDALREHFQSGMQAWPDLQADVDEVLACDDRVIAFHAAARDGDSEGGSTYELRVGVVALVKNGVITHWDQYEPEDRQAMIGRYADLGGGLALLADRPAERAFREVGRRFASGDRDDMYELFADDFKLVEHRKLGWIEADKAGHLRIVQSMLDAALDVRIEVDEMLACDDRVIATVQAFRGHSAEGGGVFEIPNGIVILVEDGQTRRVERFEPEDRAGMLARYAELGGRRDMLGDRPPERVIAEWSRAVNRGSVAAIADMFAEGIVRVDHRKLGWDEMRGRDAVREFYRSAMAMWPEHHVEVDEVLACDDRVIAFTWTMHTTSTGAAGASEIGFGVVALIENGEIQTVDQYEPDDRRAMIARYTELGGGLALLGDRPSERVVREGYRLLAKGDLDGVFALYADGHVMVDHRTLGWDETEKGARDIIESMLATTRDARWEVDEVLAREDWITAFSGAFRGTHIDGGGTFEIPYGVVVVVEDGLIRRTERYEPDDRGAMLARYAELGGRRAVLGDRPPERLLAEYRRRWSEHDVDGLLALYAEDSVRVDHRRLGWEEVRDESTREFLESFHAASPDMGFAVDEVLAYDDRVIAFSAAAYGTSVDGGGAFELANGLVWLVENRRLCRFEVFDHDDRQGMIARYVELGGGHAALGDRPPERAYREMLCRFARRDLDMVFSELLTDDYVMVDHRQLGWTETDADGHRQVMESMYAAALDVRLEVDEVLACDDRFIAALHVFRGHSSDGGGPFEIANGMVIEFVDGKMRRLERYEYDDREAMLARYAELASRPEILGDLPPERHFAEVTRRVAARDVEGLVALYAEDHVRVDHRTIGWEDIGQDSERAFWDSLFAMSPDLRAETDEVLACDDRVMASTFTWGGTSADGGGPFEIAMGGVRVVENGVWVRTELFDHDDRQAMIARYAELGGGLAALGDRPPERFLRETSRRWARRDVDMMWADDFLMVDHRSLGWSETDKEGHRRTVESMMSESADVRLDVDEVLACDDRVIAASFALRGTSQDTGGPFEIANGIVMLIENGLMCRLDRYEHGDRQAMLARYAELGGRPSIFGDRPVERVVARTCRRWTSANVDELVEVFTDDVVRVDHRSLGFEEAHGRAGIRQVYAAMLGVSAEVHIEPEEVLACDDQVLVLRATLRGTAAEGGGEFATPCGYLFVVADDRVQRLEQFEPDDRPKMVARYTELGGGLGPLGDRPPERFLRELVRRVARREVDAVIDLIADDEVTADHRKFGWSETDKPGRRDVLASMLAASLDVRFEVDEVLACDDRVIAICYAFRGHSADGGGAFEIANGLVYVVEDGLLVRADRYEYEDREAMLARYAELTGGPADVLGDRPPERHLAEYFGRFAERDLDGLLEMFSPDCVLVDHRTMAWQELGRDDVRPLFESFFAVASGMRWEVHEVLACDDRVIAYRMTFSGTHLEGGGAFEIGVGVVAVIENGLRSREEFYEPDDRRAMIARFAELGGGQGPLGDRPPERRYREMLCRFAAQDIDGCLAVVADDLVMDDHRNLGWVESDKEGMRRVLDSMLSASLDVRFEVDEVLACDDRVIALLHAFRGHNADGGGTFEIANGLILQFEDGLLQRLERYEHTDREPMLARFAELTDNRRDALGDRPPERLLAELFRRGTAREVDGFMQLVADDFVDVDHRTLPWDETGKADARVRIEGFWELTTETRFEIDEVLACDDRVIAISFAGRGTRVDSGGTYEIAYGVVAVVEGGLLRRFERYEPDDRRAIVARYAELGGGLSALGDRPPERAVAEFFRLIARRDVDAFMDLIADDQVVVDHRSLAWTETDKAGLRVLVESMLAAALDVRAEVDEILACNDRVIAYTYCWRGHTIDGGGDFEIAIGGVQVYRDGLLCRTDRYEHDDREAILARYAELAGGRLDDVLGERPPERFLAEFFRRGAARDVDGFTDLIADDFVDVDHRKLAWDEHGKAEARARVEAFLESTASMRWDVAEVLACDDRVIAVSLAFRGASVDGGAFEIPYGVVALTENGRASRWERYEPDDRRAMIARYAELGGGLGPLGDRPPERFLAELFRRTAAQDVDGFAELISDQYVEIDHRSLPCDEHGKADARTRLQGFMTSASDVRFEVDEVLACDDRAVAMSLSIRGTSVDGGGPHEIAYCLVGVVEDDLLSRVERYGPDDRQAALTRYAELGGTATAVGASGCANL